jgi:hypothetical protein
MVDVTCGAVCIFLVDGGEFRQRGAAGLDDLAQGGGAIEDYGDVDGGPANVNTSIPVLKI